MNSNRYFIEVDGSRTEINPVGKIGYTWERDSNHIFLRQELDGNLKVTGEDYNFLYDIEKSVDRCKKLVFIDQRLCNNRYADYFRGSFSLNDASFDLDKCQIELTIKNDDNIACVLEEMDKEFNILEIPNEITTTARQEDNFEYLVCRVPFTNPICNGEQPGTDGWALFYEHGNPGDADYAKIWYREIVTTVCVAGESESPGTGWTVYQDNCATANTTLWVKQPPTLPGTPVLVGGCVNGVPTPPGGGSNQVITPTTTFAAPEIVGKNGFKLSVSKRVKTPFYIKEPRAGSVYTWSITNHGNAKGTVLSGQGTDQVVIDWDLVGFTDFNVYQPTVRVQEVSSCETTAIPQASKGLYAGNTTNISSLNIVPMQFINLQEYYAAETVRFTGNYASNNTSIPFSTLYINNTAISGTVVNWGYDSKDRPFIDIKHDGTSPNINIIPTGVNAFFYGDNGAILTLGNSNATLVAIPATPAIEGQFNICGTEQLNCFSVPEFHVGATYTWSVPSGVSILSGQGTNEIKVDWGNQPSGTISVEQALAVSPQYQLIGGCPPGPNSFWIALNGGITYDRNRSLEDVLNFIVRDVCDSVKLVISDFYQINPENASTKNYVTGKDSQTSFYYFGTKVRYKIPTSSNKATQGILTRKQLLDAMLEIHNVWWNVNDQGVFRLEHFDYWRDIKNTVNLKALYPECFFKKNHYKYESSKYKRLEKYSFMEAKYIDFVGFPIEYKNADGSTNHCLGDGIEQHNVDFITTDLAHIQNDVDDIDDEGFVMLANGSDGSDLYVIRDAGAFSTNIRNNMPLSWANLHRDYHRHNRNFKDGFMNNVFTEFISVKRIKIQDGINVPYCCENTINFEGLVTGSFGAAEVLSAKLDVQKQLLTLELIY